MPLFVLMLAPFAFGTGAFVFAGLLDPMAADLGVSVAAAGQLQSAFAVACALGGPVLAVVTRRHDRQRLLVAVLVFLAFANAVSAMADSFTLLLAVRIVAGFFGALALPMASTLAVLLVSETERPRALALVVGGNTLAFLIGIPLGSLAGSEFGWAASFWMTAGLCALVAGLTAALVPATGVPPPPPPGAFARVLRWPMTGLFLLTGLGFAATFSSTGYVGPVITRLTGFTGTGIGVVQMLVGLGSILGLAFGARLAAAVGTRALPALMATIVATQLLFFAAMAANPGPVAGMVLTVLAITPGAAALFAVSPIVQNRLAAEAGPAATVAFALNGSMIFLGQGLGVVLGGGAISVAGLPAVGLAGAGVAIGGLLLSLRIPALRPRPVA
ncbi:MAG: MFS transporter [Rhodobacteraceae bacterium]|nr:MFS transporter [Paracoccaceae bacterium]